MSLNAEGKLTDEKWRAVVGNDAAYDGIFYYAVQTTGIFCRPSCRSKAPNRANVRIFPNTEAAIDAGFRPCKRCRPVGKLLPNEEWAKQIADYIDGHFHEELSLDLLADLFHGSPWHLHRTFKRVKGDTPVQYIRNTRIGQAKTLLVQTDRTVADIGERVGMPNTPYFISQFKRITGHTPAAFRKLRKLNREGSPAKQCSFADSLLDTPGSHPAFLKKNQE